MKFQKAVAAAVAVTLFSAAPAMAACYTGQEASAAHFRMLQTELMVAALKCHGHPSLDLAGQYNLFVKKFSSKLNQNADVLRQHFSRNYGSASSRKLDAFITTLANQASVRSLHQAGFCEETAPLFDKALASDAKDIGVLATEMYQDQTTRPLCGGKAEIREAKKPEPAKPVKQVKKSDEKKTEKKPG